MKLTNLRKTLLTTALLTMGLAFSQTSLAAHSRTYIMDKSKTKATNVLDYSTTEGLRRNSTGPYFYRGDEAQEQIKISRSKDGNKEYMCTIQIFNIHPVGGDRMYNTYISDNPNNLCSKTTGPEHHFYIWLQAK